MLQKLPILLAQVQVNNTSENLLNKNQQIYYSLYLANEISKNVYMNFTLKNIKKLYGNNKFEISRTT